MSKLSYLAYCLAHRWSRAVCPSCGSAASKRIDAKFFNLTTLLQCQECFLRYRCPTDSHVKNYNYYQNFYIQKGLTTDLPGKKELSCLLKAKFAGTEKDFSAYSGVIKEISRYLGRKLTILDYGANWGYSCFQFRHYDEVESVYGLELSKPRREFGEANLGVKYIDNPSDLNASVDLLFSSHVIEHMSNPSMIKECADRVLKPDGVVLLTCPNGSDSARFSSPGWRKLWGEVHPNFISDQYLCRLFSDYHGTILGDDIFTLNSGLDRLLLGQMASSLPTASNLFLIAQKGYSMP
jgi:hypothetical protein